MVKNDWSSNKLFEMGAIEASEPSLLGFHREIRPVASIDWIDSPVLETITPRIPAAGFGLVISLLASSPFAETVVGPFVVGEPMPRGPLFQISTACLVSPEKPTACRRIVPRAIWVPDAAPHTETLESLKPEVSLLTFQSKCSIGVSKTGTVS
jgi:hypothetical protein